MSGEPSTEVSPPKRKLTDTAAGQSIFVGLWVLGTLAVLIAAAGAFLLGQSVGGHDDTAATEVFEEVAEPVIEFPKLTGVPKEPGPWEWRELAGGECIAVFEGAFAEQFSVVPCETPHDAQLVHAELLSASPDALYPGDDEVLAQAREMCDVRERVDYTVASEYSDLIVDYSYPVGTEQWDAGERGVYCFVLRQSGDSLEGDLVP